MLTRRQLLLSILFGVFAGLTASLGAVYGYQKGYADAIQGGFGPGVDVESVDTQEEHVIDGYTIRLQDWNVSEYDDMVGYTTGNDDIYIRSSRSLQDIYITCVHEKLHNLYPEREHDWVYQESVQRIDPTCLKLMTQINTTDIPMNHTHARTPM